MRSNMLVATLLLLMQLSASACMGSAAPRLQDSTQRVKSDFDSARFVVVARIVHLGKRPAKFPPGEVEIVQFRVERTYKGTLKPGDGFMIESGFTSCGLSVRSADWLPVKIGKKKANPSAYPERWLIYYSQAATTDGNARFEISWSTETQPLENASYDVRVLKRFAGQWELRQDRIR